MKTGGIDRVNLKFNPKHMVELRSIIMVGSIAKNMINDEMKWSLSIITKRLVTIIIRITHHHAYNYWNSPSLVGIQRLTYSCV